jgi:hypothetical protein
VTTGFGDAGAAFVLYRAGRDSPRVDAGELVREGLRGPDQPNLLRHRKEPQRCLSRQTLVAQVWPSTVVTTGSLPKSPPQAVRPHPERQQTQVQVLRVARRFRGDPRTRAHAAGRTRLRTGSRGVA